MIGGKKGCDYLTTVLCLLVFLVHKYQHHSVSSFVGFMEMVLQNKHVQSGGFPAKGNLNFPLCLKTCFG